MNEDTRTNSLVFGKDEDIVGSLSNEMRYFPKIKELGINSLKELKEE